MAEKSSYMCSYMYVLKQRIIFECLCAQQSGHIFQFARKCLARVVTVHVYMYTLACWIDRLSFLGGQDSVLVTGELRLIQA